MNPIPPQFKQGRSQEFDLGVYVLTIR